jgi:hypothetical protein
MCIITAWVNVFVAEPSIAVRSGNDIVQSVQTVPVPVDRPSDEDAINLTLKQKLDTVMQHSIMNPFPSTGSTASSINKQLMGAIKEEVAFFNSSGTRGRCLQTVYSYLLTIPPTLVKAERAFSAAGIFNTKLRSRLMDRLIDTLCFLRAFYSRNRH